MKTFVTLLAGVALVGCGSSSSSDGTVAKPPPSPADVAKDIQNSPNMSPEAKQAALAAVQQHQAMGQGMAAHPQTK